jgi:hypothetical protein
MNAGPIVAPWLSEKTFREKGVTKLVFPTDEAPLRTILNLRGRPAIASDDRHDTDSEERIESDKAAFSGGVS